MSKASQRDLTSRSSRPAGTKLRKKAFMGKLGLRHSSGVVGDLFVKWGKEANRPKESE